MNRKNILEKHLLSRSYDQDKIDELLEARYTFTGMVLLPTSSEEESKKSLLHHQASRTIDSARKTNTRLEIRAYFDKVKAEQKKLIRRIQQYNQKKHKNPFPLHKFISKIPQYEDFEPMHDLWQQYIQNLIFPDIKDETSKLPNKQMILSKLSSAEYNGCLVTVLESRNHNVIGLQGIVVYDTQYTLVLAVPRSDESPAKSIGGLRFIPKRFTLFSFDVMLPHQSEYLTFTLLGSRIELRAVDRSTKKFKNHRVEDLL